MSKRLFSYKAEAGQNAYTGVISFQHFRGEEMYSDIAVTPEGQRTETERVECYPISADAPAGDYEVAIGIDSEPMPRIYFATDAPMRDGYYTVGKIRLERN